MSARPAKCRLTPRRAFIKSQRAAANIWDRRDAFHFAYNQVEGDFHFSADVSFVGEGVDMHRKAGIMIRDGLDHDAAYADIMFHGDGLVALQYRAEKGANTEHIVPRMTHASRMRLEREGDYVYMSLAQNEGDPFERMGGNVRLKIEETAYVGLAVSAHNNDVTETALFSNVEFTPVQVEIPEDTGYPAIVDSTLEIIDIGDGRRQIVRHLEGVKFEAPNWTRNGAHLIYNQEGLIYQIPIGGGEPQQINTGPRTQNNNDHGISPDGSQLIISDTSESGDADISRIYVLPISGSDNPELVASHPSASSYWHAWSPDGSTIAYTALRPEVSSSYNIWMKRLDGGEEWRLTDTDGLDDGADYSPDGEWVYYNSTRSGHMNIWRIRPDGTDAEQVTFSETTRDWFPHPSPDGKWIAYISFGMDIDVMDHPPNRDVSLMLVPTDGSAPPRTLAKFFGGQGSINVPSWSPDSRRLAFVSYRFAKDQTPE